MLRRRLPLAAGFFGLALATLAFSTPAHAAAAAPSVPSPTLLVSSFNPGSGVSGLYDVNLGDTASCQNTNAGGPVPPMAFDVALAPDGTAYELQASGAGYTINRLGTDTPGSTWVTGSTVVATLGAGANGLTMINGTYAYAAGGDLLRADVSTGAVVDLGPLPAADLGDLTFKNGMLFYLGAQTGANPTALYGLPVADLGGNTAAAGSIPASDWTDWGTVTGLASPGYGLATDANGHTWILAATGQIYPLPIPSSAQPSIAVGASVRALTSCLPGLEWSGLASAAEGANASLPGLSITLSGPATAVRGSDVAYTITVTNAVTAGPADNVQITDPLPSQLTTVSVASPDCSALPCIIPTIAPGMSETITVTASIPAGYSAAAPFTTQATAGCAAGDLLCNVSPAVTSAVLSTAVTTAPTPTATPPAATPTAAAIPVPATGADGGSGPAWPWALGLTATGIAVLLVPDIRRRRGGV